MQQSTSLNVFKQSLSLSDSKVPAYYYFEERSAQVIHCRLRLEMSNINNDLVNRNLSTDPKCSCVYSKETTEHYLLHCPNYSNIRARTILTIPSGQTDIRRFYYSICPQMYFFITIPVQLFLLFRHNLHNDLSTHLLGYIYTDTPENIFTCLPSCFRLTTKTYLSPQLLVYKHIDVPVHGPTCSCS